MYITNIRRGFATNSSSSHSIILKKGSLPDRRPTMPGEFGWERFVLASQEAKKEYLKALVVENIKDQGIDERFLAYLGLETSYLIDHDSVMYLPKTCYGALSYEFFEDFSRWVLDDRIAILGGNDNDIDAWEWQPELGQLVSDDPLGKSFRDYEARKNGNYWVLFNRHTGDRIRLRFHDQPLEPEFPELVDVSITDYCDLGCSFCYRDSTPEGKHADDDYIIKLVQTFPPGTEMAIGGGDPLSHPALDDVLKWAHLYGLVTNLTIRGSRWVTNEKLVKAINDYVSAVGISVNSASDARHHIPRILQVLNPRIHVVVHYIPSLHTLPAMAELFAEVAALRRHHDRPMGILLLGFKSTGRGARIEKPHPLNDFAKALEALYEIHDIPISADTALFKEYSDLAKIVPYIYQPDTEGAFSMFIDAVKKKVYKSSYDETEQGIPMPVSSRDEIRRCFAAIRNNI